MLDAMLAVEQQAGDAASAMLREALDIATQQQTALLNAMLEANASGLGANVNTYA